MMTPESPAPNAESDHQRPMSVTEQILHASPDAILIVDEGGVIVAANERCQGMFSYTPDDLIGRSIELLVPTPSRSSHVGLRTSYIERPRVRPMGGSGARLQAQRADGSLVPVDVALSTVTIDGSTMAMAVVRDVSRQVAAELELDAIRREAEGRLRLSEAAFRSAFDDAAVPMAILDLEDLSRQRIVRANEALATMFGIAVDDLVGRSTVELTHPEDREVSRSRAAALLRGKTGYRIEHRYRRPNGSYLWAAVHASPLSIVEPDEEGNGGSDQRCLVHIVDITRRIEAEQERDRREELLAALAGVRKAALDERVTDDVLQLIVAAVADALQVEVAFIACSDQSGQLQVRTHRESVGPDWYQTVLPAGNVAARVLKTSEIEVVPVPGALSHLLPDEASGSDPIGPLVVVPLHTANSVEGILVMARGEGAPLFTEHDLTVAQSLAAEAAVTLVLARAREDRRHMLLVEDRERIARDLHDVVIQRLYATGMRLQSAAGRPDLLAERANEAVGDLDDTIADVRNAIFQLTKPDNTVAGELRRLIDRHRASGRCALTLEIEGDIEVLSPVVVNHLLPTVNELLSNVDRHAEASEALVTVTVDQVQLAVTVRDDGIGLRPGAGQGFGLRNLTKRAMSLGGSLEYEEATDQGAELRWSVPLA